MIQFESVRLEDWLQTKLTDERAKFLTIFESLEKKNQQQQDVVFIN